ncbi:MAG: nitroreductase family protein, partial [Pseudomonadota bacterium]
MAALAPTAALTEEMPIAETQPFERGDSRPSSILELLESRYTVRVFDEGIVPESVLEKVEKAGSLAPSQGKRFSYKIVKLGQSTEAKQLRRELYLKYATCTHCIDEDQKVTQFISSLKTGGANYLFFMSPFEDKKASYSWNAKPFDHFMKANTDAMIAANFMLIEAEAQGLGTAFTGLFNPSNSFMKRL